MGCRPLATGREPDDRAGHPRGRGGFTTPGTETDSGPGRGAGQGTSPCGRAPLEPIWPAVCRSPDRRDNETASLIGPMKNPARLLAAGLATLALAGALAPLVMLGLIGLLLFPVGLLLTGSAIRAGRDGEPHSGGGAWLAWLGALLVAVSAFQGGSLAFAVFIHRLHPGASAPAASLTGWLVGLLIAVAGAALLSAGLRRYPGFSPDHGLRWFAAAASVFPVSAVLFLLLARWFPITA